MVVTLLYYNTLPIVKSKEKYCRDVLQKTEI